MSTLTKEQEKALREYRKLKLQFLKHWQKYGFRKPWHKTGSLDKLETDCFRLGLGNSMRSMSFTD